MDRRNFIITGSLAGLSFSTLSFTPGGSLFEEKSFEDDFKLNEITIAELQRNIQSGIYTSRSVTQMYLDRINRIDKSGPNLNSIIEINPDALVIAETLDSERKKGKLRGPLHGIPVLIKDNIDTADKMLTTAGSIALLGNVVRKDAFMVKKLREAGAIILGKTNLSEWANFRSTRSVSGWSSRGGQTKNPYMLDRSPCGSSSGSAVAVAANLCAIAVGTETDGSIACPASMNNIVGIKPTVGLISRSGIIPISKTQDTAGPFARTVTDAAILLGALTGIDKDDEATNESRGKSKQDYTKFLDLNGLRGKRIGVDHTLLKHHERIDELLSRSLEQMKNNGAVIVEVDFMNKYHEDESAEFEILKYEFKDGLNRYLASTNGKMKSLQDIIDFDNRNEAKVMPFFRQEIFDSSQVKGGLESKEYLDSIEKLRVYRNFINDLMEKNQLTALCGPATGPSWCIDFVNGDFWTGYGAYSPAAVTGYPSITVPMGLVEGLPIGITFIGKAYSEPELIAIAYAYEQISKNRRVPKFLKSFER